MLMKYLNQLHIHILAILICVAATPAQGAAPEQIDYVKQVRPILQKHCYSCHGAEKQKSGLRLDIKTLAFKGGDGFGPAILPKNAGESPLYELSSGADPDAKMPPKGPGLSVSEKLVIKQWIDQGATWPDGVDLAKVDDKTDHWSFKPVTQPALPVVKNPEWMRNPIDRFILNRLERENLPPSPPADRRTWLRRVSLDLTGLLPTPEQTEAFLNDNSPTAFERVVDRLLLSPRYGERWAQHWLDVVRYADTHGFEVNTERPNAWPYRDFVIRALNQDLPFDRFIREQIAGDTLGQDAATGFLVTSAVLLPGQIGADDASKRLARQDELAEIVINTGQTFLGLTIGCARCHDHKFDPITSRDFYSMQAFFAGVEYGDRTIPSTEADSARTAIHKQLAAIDRELVSYVPMAKSGTVRPMINARSNIDRFQPILAKRVRLTINKTNNLEPCIDELEVFDTSNANIALASRGATVVASGSNVSPNRHELRLVNDGVYGNSSSWMSNQMGGGWVQVEFPDVREINRVDWGRDREGKFKDRLAVDYKIEISVENDKWLPVADVTDREAFDPQKSGAEVQIGMLPEQARAAAEKLLEQKRRLESELKKYADGGMLVYAGTFRKPDVVKLLFRGDPEQPREPVKPTTLSLFGDMQLPAESSDIDRRRALADWLASPSHPLTARVAVNRIWQGHFGTGIVESSNDFGNSGTPPSHPELLDWLAGEFVRRQWSVKQMHRLIVLSATYRQSGAIRPDAQAKDADARLLWRYPTRRMEAELIRDNTLQLGGQLNLQMGGRGFDLFKSRGGLNGFPPIEKFDATGKRRLIYAHKVRMEREIVFGAFDCPDAGQSMARRKQSTTPIQALNLFNSEFTIDQATAFADRVQAESGQEIGCQIDLAFELAFTRHATPEEIRTIEPIVREHGLKTLCRAILNSNEFLFIP